MRLRAARSEESARSPDWLGALGLGTCALRSAKIPEPDPSLERATIILEAVGPGPPSDEDCTRSMQNRSMFPYRRHGPKKRSKGGGPMRKPHGPQKVLPNSARDLLPMLQPATKALAQMLAGRTQMSGQLEQARAVLAQAERLIGDRVHNRLNPAEREEFFEQIARLRLTLADADSEAEFRAAEQQAPARPAPPPIAQERLKEMAMALATPEGRRRPSPGDDAVGPAPAYARDDRQRLGPDPSRSSGPEPELEGDGSLPAANNPDPAAAPAAKDPEPAAPAPEGPRRLLAINKPGRLELPKDAALDVARTMSIGRSRGIGRRRPVASGPRLTAPALPASVEVDEVAAAPTGHELAANGGADRPKPPRRSRKTQQGLPEGWIIDDEGFVVPGPE
jgi:hypothetical protein